MYYDRNHVSKEIDLNKSNKRNECMICHYCFLIMASYFKIMYAIVVMI